MNLLTVESCQKYLQSNFKVNGLKLRESNREGAKGKDNFLKILLKDIGIKNTKK